MPEQIGGYKFIVFFMTVDIASITCITWGVGVFDESIRKGNISNQCGHQSILELLKPRYFIGSNNLIKENTRKGEISKLILFPIEIE